MPSHYGEIVHWACCCTGGTQVDKTLAGALPPSAQPRPCPCSTSEPSAMPSYRPPRTSSTSSATRSSNPPTLPTPTPTARYWTVAWSVTSWASTRTPTEPSGASPPSGAPSRRCTAASRGPKGPSRSANVITMNIDRNTPIPSLTLPSRHSRERGNPSPAVGLEPPPT